MAIEVHTFGCRLNAYESEVMRTHAGAAGLTDVIIVNTCTVTAEAERQARQAIRKARREHPEARLVVTGCAAQVRPEHFAAMPEVDVVLGNEDKLKAGVWARLGVEEAAPRLILSDIMEVKETAAHLISGFEAQTRAFVQVQNGCNHRCTFCIIPYGRGNSRSVPMGEIVAQVRLLVARGYKEVVFTGVDVSAYGEDLPGQPTLGALVRRTLKAVPELPRLRLSSIDAAEIDSQLWDALAEEPRLMPHLHLSVQAGDDMVLKRMKRRHSRADIVAFAQKAHRLRPDVVLGADIIAGFPTEDEDMFLRTLHLVAEARLTWLHVFPYSPREGTPAAKMPQVPAAVRKARAARLRDAGRTQEQAFLASRIGTPAQVLVEQDGIGRTEHFAPVKVGSGHLPGSIISTHVSGVQGHHLIAQA